MGGAEKALIDMIKYLKDKVEIDLYLLEKKGPLINELPKEVNVYQIKNNIFKYCLFRYVSFCRKKVINNIANAKDYHYAFGYMEGRSVTWVNDIKKKLKKYGWIHNDVLKFDIGISDKEAINSYNGLDKVICVSNDSKNNFCKKYGISESKVEVIYNFINEEDILEKASEFSVDKKKITFINVAKMRDQKRHDRLIEAAKKLRDDGFEFEMWLIGDGPNLEKITNMVYNYNLENIVKIFGLKTNPYPYIKCADYFVLSSFMEGYGIVIKEALFLKTRVISTDVVGPREILENGKYGIIVPNEDEAIYNILKEVLCFPKKYDYLDTALSKYKGDNETIKKQVFKLLDL